MTTDTSGVSSIFRLLLNQDGFINDWFFKVDIWPLPKIWITDFLHVVYHISEGEWSDAQVACGERRDTRLQLSSRYVYESVLITDCSVPKRGMKTVMNSSMSCSWTVIAKLWCGWEEGKSVVDGQIRERACESAGFWDL